MTQKSRIILVALLTAVLTLVGVGASSAAFADPYVPHCSECIGDTGTGR